MYIWSLLSNKIHMYACIRSLWILLNCWVYKAPICITRPLNMHLSSNACVYVHILIVYTQHTGCSYACTCTCVWVSIRRCLTIFRPWREPTTNYMCEGGYVVLFHLPKGSLTFPLSLPSVIYTCMYIWIYIYMYTYVHIYTYVHALLPVAIILAPCLFLEVHPKSSLLSIMSQRAAPLGCCLVYLARAHADVYTYIYIYCTCVCRIERYT